MPETGCLLGTRDLARVIEVSIQADLPFSCVTSASLCKDWTCGWGLALFLACGHHGEWGRVVGAITESQADRHSCLLSQCVVPSV